MIATIIQAKIPIQIYTCEIEISLQKSKEMFNTMNLNFNDNVAAQDMISIIIKEKGLSAEKAVKFAVNKNICEKILSTGWASIALDLWGHDDPDRKWSVIDNPTLEIVFEETEQQLINTIVKKENVDIETAICYFIIFTMEELGYHI